MTAMAPDRDDDIEEEPFEFEEEDVVIDLPGPKERAARRRRLAESEDGAGPREEGEPEENEYEEEEAVSRGSREKLEAVLAGISPRALRLVLAGVVAFAAALVVAAYIHKSRSKERHEQARRQREIARALKFMAELKQIGDDYFRPNGQLPKDFKTRFRPEPGDENDERRHVLGVGVQSRPPGSATFETRATAFNHKFASLGEVAQRNPTPLPGTEIYPSKLRVVINMVEYDARVYRQVIRDEKGATLGRVVLMMFAETK